MTANLILAATPLPVWAAFGWRMALLWAGLVVLIAISQLIEDWL